MTVSRFIMSLHLDSTVSFSLFFFFFYISLVGVCSNFAHSIIHASKYIYTMHLHVPMEDIKMRIHTDVPRAASLQDAMVASRGQ